MDDFDFNSGGYSLWGDTPDIGSAFDFGGNDFSRSFSLGEFGGPAYSQSPPSLGFNSSFDTSWLAPYTQGAGGFQQGPLGIPQPQGATLSTPPGAAGLTQDPRGGGANPWISAGLGALGPIAGLIGALASGGQGPSQGPRPTTAQQANMNIGNQWAQMGAQGQLPAQQMQMSLLQALAGGQGLPPGYQRLVEQAFEPQLGSLYNQATQAGRARGFHDAPAQSPPGGAILGPGLSNLQGQMASAKLGLMHSLPQLFNQPAATQGQLAGSYLGQAQGAPMRQTTQQPMGSTIAGNVGNILSGAAQGYNAAEAQRQQADSLNSILRALQGGQRGGLSYT